MPTFRPHEDPAPLSEREREILRLVVQSFVQTAGPVGSRTLVKRYGLELSPASIRNTMSDLEEAGYLEHPYTSAGRVPTARGYRTFVDELMQTPRLSSGGGSRLLDYDGYSGYAPVSLLPEDERWLGDYGPYAVSTFAYDDDYYDDYGYDDGYYYGYGGGVQPNRSNAPRGQSSAAVSPMLQGTSDDTYRTVTGAEVRMRREAEIQRIE